MNEDQFETDPVLAEIRAEAERMLADSAFAPGPPKKKAHKVAALAPTIRALRAQGRTWPAIAKLCKDKGLAVTAKTLRVVIRELDAIEQRARGEEPVTSLATARSPARATTGRRKKGGNSNGKSSGKSPGSTGDDATTSGAHTNGRAHVRAANDADAAPENASRKRRTPVSQTDAESTAATSERNDARHDRALPHVPDPPPVAIAASAGTGKSTAHKSQRRYGAKGIEF